MQLGWRKRGMRILSNLRSDQHLTFHNLQTLGMFLGIPQWDVMAALIKRR